ncbi:hypothetical protein Tco_1320646 [Tanacetum coccineum]
MSESIEIVVNGTLKGEVKRRRKKGNESISSSLDLVAMDSNFPPLHEQATSSIVDEFVEHVAVTIGNIRDGGFAGTCLTSSTHIHNDTVSAVPASPSKNGSADKNDGEQVGNEPGNKFPLSYVTEPSPTSSPRANLQKLEVNVPTDADYDVWLHLTSVHEVNDRMKNSLYGYFIGKRLLFIVMEWFVRNNWEEYGF